ncbi:hypothetical protein N7457_005971 [Penicillium paradoxum]|uniref:uncharacterized protein n=1 Tax=Penicillium paradoxum TaxID=176176 RepID=UPI002546A328|nr:uncharacterized protein N7457_005971 [Penicillium paradoxum]KAJ5780811.1 hypothetical protein N7457_005971 [Penicillium paradoxum]
MLDFFCIYPMCFDDRRCNTRIDLDTDLLSFPDPVATRNPDPPESFLVQSDYMLEPMVTMTPDITVMESGSWPGPLPWSSSSCIPTKRTFHQMKYGIEEPLKYTEESPSSRPCPPSVMGGSTLLETHVLPLPYWKVEVGVNHHEENIQARSPLLAPIPEEIPEDPETEELKILRSESAISFTDFESSTSTWDPVPSAPMNSTTPVTAGDGSSSLLSTTQSLPVTLLDDTGDNEDTSSVASITDHSDSVFDDRESDNTSNYTASLLSDVKNYTYENGRRYHSYREGHYVLPNDEPEQDRQDLLHHVRNLVLNGRLFRAPLHNNIQRALDIGTGTGIWAIDFADSFPSAEVTGTDLSPIQPSWVPPNLRFVVDDAESPWLYSPDRPFDFIHARDLGGAIADWPRLIRQSHEHLRPGGWIELQEFEVMLRSDDDSIHLAPALCEFLERLTQASEAFHRPMNIAEGHRQRLIEAGFEDVRDEMYKVRPTLAPGRLFNMSLLDFASCLPSS